jgi:nucleotide-binding universal stress UspA family protein
MSIRVVLGLIDGGPVTEAAAGAAVAVADAFDAHLQLLHVRPDPESLVPMIGEGMSGVMLDQMVEGFRAESQERSAVARRLYDALTARRAGVPADGKATLAFREEEGREDEVAGRFARLHDLTVLARAEKQAGVPASVTLESLLLHSGRPVLVAPAQPVRSIGRKVVVAWNGKMQAARALAAGLPFLSRAEAVTVLTALEAAEIPAQSPGKVGQILLDHVAQSGADLLVMGAYGHSRLREMILGGATREVLDHVSLPVLMAH